MQPKLCNPLTIKSASREDKGLRTLDGVLAIAANIKARLVADFDPGLLIFALIGSPTEDNQPRNGALQFVICTRLPSIN